MGRSSLRSIVCTRTTTVFRQVVRNPRYLGFNMLTSVLGSVALLVGSAAAHGAVTSYVIAGKNYPG